MAEQNIEELQPLLAPYRRKDRTALERTRLFVLDMDGTFYLGDRLIEGALEFIKKLGDTGRRFVFFTNNSSKTSEFYVEKLDRMGCRVDIRDVITSGDVTVSYLKQYYAGKKVFLLGTPLLRKNFEEAGICLVEEAPDIVVLGFDMTFSYDRVSRACTYIREGAVFIATHPDFNCPTEDGFIPDCGAMTAMITASTGVAPKVLGKPHGETIEMVQAITGVNREEMAFVGDRLYTDIAIGVHNGVTSILVLSGETTLASLEASAIQPDYVFACLGDLAGEL